MRLVGAEVAAAVSGARVDLSNEKNAQAGLAEALRQRLPHISVEREVRLSDSDIVDILVDHGVVVEVKLRGTPKRQVFRQLERYAEHGDVRAIVLVSNTSMGLPSEIAGKPAYFVSLGRGWL